MNIIELAKEAGILEQLPDETYAVVLNNIEHLERFAALVQAEGYAAGLLDSDSCAKALAEPVKRPQNCGTGYCSCIECPYEQPVQQEPVAEINEHGRLILRLNWNQVPFGSKLYAAPVDAKAIRAEALEEAAKMCERKEIPFDIELWRNSTKKEMTAHTAIALAAAIRGLE